MKVWISTDFSGFYPVGTSAVVTAPTEAEAHKLLDDACKRSGLSGFDGTLHLLDLNAPAAHVLQNGGY